MARGDLSLPRPHRPPDPSLGSSGPDEGAARSGTALCLSGGGYRAALFHLGAVRRLDELGMLGRLRTVAGVSGGAILAALLGHPGLGWPETTAAGDQARVAGLQELVAQPLRALAGRNIRTPALLSRLTPTHWFTRDGAVRALAGQLRAALPSLATALDQVPVAGPRVEICATELGFGMDWVFAAPAAGAPQGTVGDDRLGYGPPPTGLTLADAVAASAAFPPYFAPLRLDTRGLNLQGGSSAGESDEVRRAIRADVQLSDGGIYDNLGLERVWSDHAAILIGDGGGVFRAASTTNLLGRLQQTLAIATGGGQSTWLRGLFAVSRRSARAATARAPGPTPSAAAAASARASAGEPRAASEDSLVSALWELDDLVEAEGAYPREVVELVNTVRTDLDAFTVGEQRVLERHGYVVADAAVRAYAGDLVVVDAPLVPPWPEVADPKVAAEALANSHKQPVLGRW